MIHEWIDIADSDRVVAIAYDATAEVIYVRFPNNREWWYQLCPPTVWEEFTAPGTSKGRYIHNVLNHKPNGPVA